ncbi:hypothetical protein R6Q57_002139 [Mikania cordata]
MVPNPTLQCSNRSHDLIFRQFSMVQSLEYLEDTRGLEIIDIDNIDQNPSRLGPSKLLMSMAQENFLGHLAHPNIIRLLGYCRDKLEHLLVYEYMPNKSFNRSLFSGVARGLTYLHSKNIIHRDLKSSHILLDENLNAKLGGFGSVRCGPETGETHVITRVMGTPGYIAPEYMATGHLTTKCDIFSFGVVLLESKSGPSDRKAVDLEELKIMDPRLEGKYPLHGASEYVAVALRCVADNPKNRPSGEEVLQSLEQIYALN